MTQLDEYLQGPYVEDGRFLRKLNEAVALATPTFYETATELPLERKVEASGKSWPYAVTSASPGGPARQLNSVSTSTHCMILFALDALWTKKTAPSSLLGSSFRPMRFEKPVEQASVSDVLQQAKKTLVDLIYMFRRRRPLVRSSTYGNDDPFTLTWMAEILLRMPRAGENGSSAELAAAQGETVAVANEALGRKAFLDTAGSEGGFKEVKSCFLEMRKLHLAKAIADLGKEDGETAKSWITAATPDLWTRFDDEMRRQLSYAATADSRFDPSELAFSLEGALLVHPTWVSPGAIDAVLQHLHLSSDRQPFWRPVTPLLANDKGHVLFLISIEVANSILRACELADEHDPRMTRFAKIEPDLRRYVGWLLEDREEVPLKDPVRSVVGWRPEYEEKSVRGTVFLWYTSHVVVFLAHYHAMLKRKIAADAAEAAGLVAVRKPRIKRYFEDEPLEALSKGERYRVLTTVNRLYIERRHAADARGEPPMSMIVFGPPGTGKTTLGEQLAERLGQALIVVTVSDFLAAGAADLENRAKGVFEVLKAQEDVVILFDEIDQFLLDRNTKLYKAQDDVFKFMTPGMLTKLQDLRDAKRSIFIIATNYFERVDSAIRRPGRIDQHLLLSIPDKSRRAALIHKFAADLLEKQGSKEPPSAADLGRALDERGVLRETALFGFGDLKSLVELRVTLEPGMAADAVAEAIYQVVGTVEPSVSLGAYRSRFDADSPHPYEEFLLVLYLQLEAGKALAIQDQQVVGDALLTISGFDGGNGFELLNRKGYAQDSLLFAALKEHKAVLVEAWREASGRREALSGRAGR